MPTNDNQDIQVVVSAFDDETKKWFELADLMATLKGKTADLNLYPTAFFCGNPATSVELSKAYDEIYDLVRTLMSDAEKEFDQIAEALRVAASLYDGTDRNAATNLVKIYGP